MSNTTKDEGIIAALLERFEMQRLPRTIALNAQAFHLYHQITEKALQNEQS
jgi:hypothetical protein